MYTHSADNHALTFRSCSEMVARKLSIWGAQRRISFMSERNMVSKSVRFQRVFFPFCYLIYFHVNSALDKNKTSSR